MYSLLIIFNVCTCILYDTIFFRHTYECAPAFTVIEQYVIKKINEKIGYTEGDGVFMPGMLIYVVMFWVSKWSYFGCLNGVIFGV